MQLRAIPLQRRRIGDDGLDAVALEQLLEQQKFGIQVLHFGRAVDDRHQAQRTCLARQAPLLKEHRDDFLLESCASFSPVHGTLRKGTARVLRARQGRVQQRAAGIGIDFNKVDAIALEVKIVAEKHAMRALGQASDVGRVLQDQCTVGGQGHHGFDGVDQRLHLLRLRRRNIHRQRREQMRAAFGDQRRHAGRAGCAAQRLRQRVQLQAAAKTAAVQLFGRLGGAVFITR